MIERGVEEELQPGDRRVQRDRRRALVDQMQLEAAQVLGGRGVGRAVKKDSELAHGAHIAGLRLGLELAQVHVLEHALTQRRDARCRSVPDAAPVEERGGMPRSPTSQNQRPYEPPRPPRSAYRASGFVHWPGCSHWRRAAHERFMACQTVVRCVPNRLRICYRPIRVQTNGTTSDLSRGNADSNFVDTCVAQDGRLICTDPRRRARCTRSHVHRTAVTARPRGGRRASRGAFAATARAEREARSLLSRRAHRPRWRPHRRRGAPHASTMRPP